jgi:hypothetical protein
MEPSGESEAGRTEATDAVGCTGNAKCKCPCRGCANVCRAEVPHISVHVPTLSNEEIARLKEHFERMYKNTFPMNGYPDITYASADDTHTCVWCGKPSCKAGQAYCDTCQREADAIRERVIKRTVARWVAWPDSWAADGVGGAMRRDQELPEPEGPRYGTWAARARCATCRGRIGYVDCPTGGWWAHATHPADEHDAEPRPEPRWRRFLRDVRSAFLHEWER